MALPSVGSTVGHHYGCFLGPIWHRLLQVYPGNSLAPPSGPPWSFLSSPWLLFPPLLLLPLPPPWTLFAVLLLSPPEFPLMPPSVVIYGARTCLPGGG
ncbi:Highly reducing polyketide synthase 19 [Labeo rohita]|uniref:Highly reducing polyketide synthase 19 n=1 Tax=Labeo rohita TaxID=84645 RepID=A0ABQ8MFX6_LABRO|nr:Highly reducing polyketide synthase 19 [Labeo rohita]